MVLTVDWLAFSKVPNLMEVAGMSLVTLSVMGISICDTVTGRIANLFKVKEVQSKDIEQQQTTRV